ncbi:two-component system, response regulator YesN [Terribacillus halophilus]|uniref:Two-component system, response regulator YesN n=1 Tax=Terribacillus halophilus TaxID=361279 RepID=A0A1G6KWF9_9BACI|nr:helix-turn-helix domain-containing protein [Terribacillus halophilus]SDC35324.1 two-component system, response regulator YesN [Terribacillus halophilus]
MKALLVDDEKNGRDVLRMLGEWEKNGISCLLEASDGEGALQLIEMEQPEIIFTDIRMPRMDGVQLIERLHAIGYMGKYVLVTGYDDYQFMRKAIQFNSFDYLLKPIEPEAFAEVLEKVTQAVRSARRYEEREAAVLEDAKRMRLEQQVTALCTKEAGNTSLLREALPQIERLDFTLLSFYQKHQPASFMDALADELQRSAIGDVFRFQQEEHMYIVLTAAGHWLQVENWLRQHLDIPVRLVQKPLPALEGIPAAFGLLRKKLAQHQYRTIRRLEELESEQRGQDIVTYVRNYYMEDVSLERLSKLFFLTKEHISRKFKQETGMTLSRFVTNCRMEQAKQWLEETDKTLYDIALLLGYQDEKYFSKLFKKETTLTPTAYRAKLREQEEKLR